MKKILRRRAKTGRTTERPDQMYQAMPAEVSAVVSKIATAPPAMPNAGTGPRPKISKGDSGISNTTPTQIATDGTSMLPVPRSTLASAFISHTSTAPANTMFE